MKRSTTRWTTALAAVALLGLPAAGVAQTAASPPQQEPSAAAHAQPDQPADHLRAAKAALAEIEDASVPGRAQTQLTQLKQHLNALERAAAAKSAAAAPAAQARANNWSTEVSAADRILTELLRPASASGTAGATGTSGTTGAAAAVTLDAEARAKLTEVRTHLTKFAAAMGAPAAHAPSTHPSQPPTSQPPTSQPPTSQPPTSQPPTSQPPTSQPPTSRPDDPQQPPSAQAQVDTEAVRRHLTEARETLSEMTQLPAASTLAGDTRTQVNALIANFNELITNQTDWRASYRKVEDNLNALIGPENQMAAGTPPAGTAGAVGTSGTPTLDAEIRAKLVELRAKLNEFERAAGGAPAGAAPAGAAARTPEAASPSAAADPSHGSPVDRAEALRLIESIEAILNGTSAAAPGTAGTSGTTAAPTTTSGAPLTLSRTQVEQLRTHLNELKRLVGEK